MPIIVHSLVPLSGLSRYIHSIEAFPRHRKKTFAKHHDHLQIAPQYLVMTTPQEHTVLIHMKVYCHPPI